MRARGRTDSNHQLIVAGLRKAGGTVQSLASIGNGCPDLLLGWHSRNYLLEIKSPDQPPSRRRLTDDEVNWHHEWRGKVYVVHTLEEAMQKIGMT